jgi:lipid-A-disaccharide synthase-like uncharacterized protein
MFDGADVAIVGCFGGLAAELVQWFAIRHSLHRKLPAWARARAYWVVTLLMAVAGGALVFVYHISGTRMTPILALNVGASAPLLLGKLAQQAPAVAAGPVNRG